MTSNQLQYAANQIKKDEAAETKRSNKIKEAETQRANKAAEAEKIRSNKMNEGINRAKVEEEARHNRKDESIKTAQTALSPISSLFKGVGTAAINDPAWYNKDPQLVKDAATFSFARPIGIQPNIPNTIVGVAKDPANPTNPSNPVVDLNTSGVPGVCCLRYLHTIPDYKTMKSIADKYYAFVRHANSGSRNYESNDLSLYLIAVSEMYGQLVHAARIYSLINTYKNKNFYYADGYLKAMGCSQSFINSLRLNPAQFRSGLNTLIRKVNSFSIPNTFPLFKRKVWLNSGIYKDHEVSRSSNYMFVPDQLYMYHETDHAWLAPEPLDYEGSIDTIDTYLTQLNDMIVALYNSEDVGIMSGDIIKAYGENLVRMEEIPADYHIEENYSEEVLSQINCATIFGNVDDAYAKIFTRTEGDVSYIFLGADNPTPIANDTLGIRGPISQKNIAPGQAVSPTVKRLGLSNLYTPINLYKDQVDPDMCMVATRLQCNYYDRVSMDYNSNLLRFESKKYRELRTVGTELVVSINLLFVGNCGDCLPNAGDDPYDNEFHVIRLFDGMTYDDIEVDGLTYGSQSYPQTVRAMQVLTQVLSKFDWAPRIRILSDDFLFRNITSTPNYASIGKIVYDNFDVANIAIISEEQLKNLHLVACMSLYDL